MAVEGARFDPLKVASDAHSDIIRMTNGHAPRVWGSRVLMAQDWLRTLPPDVQTRTNHLFKEWWKLFNAYKKQRETSTES